MKLIPYHEAAKLLHVPVGTLYAWVHENRVPHVRLGARTVRFDVAALEAWVRARARQGEEADDVR
jgi:excisionase family DNA binding protein